MTQSNVSIGLLFFFFTLVTDHRRSLSLKLSDTRVYEPQIRARLGITTHFYEVIVLKLRAVSTGHLGFSHTLRVLTGRRLVLTINLTINRAVQQLEEHQFDLFFFCPDG